MISYKIIIFVFAFISFWIFTSNTSADSNTHKDICSRYRVTPTPGPELNSAKCQQVNSTLYIDGEINHSLVSYVERHASKLNHIELNSYGGLVEAGFALSEIIRRHRLTTNVRKDAKCSSICTLVYQAGVQRTAHVTARFLYHGARLMEEGRVMYETECATKGQHHCDLVLADWTQKSFQTTRRFFRAYEVLGASRRLYRDFLKQPYEPNWYEDLNLTKIQDWVLSAHESRNYGVVQVIYGEREAQQVVDFKAIDSDKKVLVSN